MFLFEKQVYYINEIAMQLAAWKICFRDFLRRCDMVINRIKEVEPWWANLMELHHDINQALAYDSHHDHAGTLFPSMRVVETESEIVVEALLPGIQLSDLGITISKDREVVIRGDKNTLTQPEKSTWHRRETDIGKFNRTLFLPVRIDSDKSEAFLEDGVLKLILPKHSSEQGRKIPISVKSI
ncbi:MAG: Hsp20/alpha crystallin family protein [Planctomycetota bacterium]|nr:MAG: Hsp20/alpha crystallin family protein [Planctomycetota bacterium]